MVARKTKLNQEVVAVHEGILATTPTVDRVACAIYDDVSDVLSTYLNSTRGGEALHAYSYKLAESVSLSELASSGRTRYIPNIRAALQPGREHSDWVLQQGYQTSFTVPLFFASRFLGFIFFNSYREAAFSESTLDGLKIAAGLIADSISEIERPIRIIQKIATLRDFETASHLRRVAAYSRLIAKGVAEKFDLDDEFVQHLFLFAPLHDVGKIGIPDEILLKPGPLTKAEVMLMKTHVELGLEFINEILDDAFPLAPGIEKILLNVIGQHHEMMDGSGYPLHLKGDQISIEGRILAVADIFDALTSKRPYKEAWVGDKALAEIRKMAAGGKLDADCVEALAVQFDAAKTINRVYQDQHQHHRHHWESPLPSAEGVFARTGTPSS